MKLKITLPSLFTARLRKLIWTFFLLVWAGVCEGQQIIWAKVYPLAKDDLIRSIAKDNFGNMYAAGRTGRAVYNPTPDLNQQGFLMKIDSNGDTLFTQYFGQYGEIFSLVVGPNNVVRINYVTTSFVPGQDQRLILIQMSEQGFVFKRDTIPFRAGFQPNTCMIGKDSSLIVAGSIPKTGAASQLSMFFLRV